MPNLRDLVSMTEQKRCNLIQRTSQPHLGLVHAFYAVMGGFAFIGLSMMSPSMLRSPPSSYQQIPVTLLQFPNLTRSFIS